MIAMSICRQWVLLKVTDQAYAASTELIQIRTSLLFPRTLHESQLRGCIHQDPSYRLLNKVTSEWHRAVKWIGPTWCLPKNTGTRTALLLNHEHFAFVIQHKATNTWRNRSYWSTSREELKKQHRWRLLVVEVICSSSRVTIAWEWGPSRRTDASQSPTTS